MSPSNLFRISGLALVLAAAMFVVAEMLAFSILLREEVASNFHDGVGKAIQNEGSGSELDTAGANEQPSRSAHRGRGRRPGRRHRLLEGVYDSNVLTADSTRRRQVRRADGPGVGL